MRMSLLATGCREKQPLSRRAAFAGVNMLIPDFCSFAKTVVASEMSLTCWRQWKQDTTRRPAAEGRPEEARRSRAGPDWRRAGASRIMDAANEKGSPKQLRVRSLGTRLSEAEYAQCEKLAARRGLTTGEWHRQVLLEAAVASPAQEPEAEVMLSEILALRKIVINLLYGEKAGGPLSEERMRELIEAADSE